MVSDMEEKIELIEELIRRTKSILVEAQDEKILCLENKRRPDIMLDSVGNMNTNQTEDDVMITHCNYIIDMAKVRVKVLEEVLDILRDTD